MAASPNMSRQVVSNLDKIITALEAAADEKEAPAAERRLTRSRGRCRAARADPGQGHPGTSPARLGRDPRDVRRHREGRRDLHGHGSIPSPTSAPRSAGSGKYNSGAGLPPPSPRAERATEALLRARLAAALDRNRHLADENARLRRQLAPHSATSGPPGTDQVTIQPPRARTIRPRASRQRQCPRRDAAGHSTGRRESSR